MKLEKKIELINKAIEDWNLDIRKCKSNFTDKCFSRYFYKVHGLNFYQAEFIKNNFYELHDCILKISGYNSLMGDLAVGPGYGDDPKYRILKLQVLQETLLILERKKSNLELISENELNVKTATELNNNNWKNIFERYNLNRICNSNLLYKESKEERNTNLDEILSLNMVDLLKSEGFVFDKKVALNKAKNCYIKLKAKNVYFVNKSLSIRNYYPVQFVNSSIPIKLKDDKVFNHLYLAGIKINKK